MPIPQTSTSHQFHSHPHQSNILSSIPSALCTSSLELIIPDRPWVQTSSFPQSSQQSEEKSLIDNIVAEEVFS